MLHIFFLNQIGAQRHGGSDVMRQPLLLFVPSTCKSHFSAFIYTYDDKLRKIKLCIYSRAIVE
jgi:hypothetical protein